MRKIKINSAPKTVAIFLLLSALSSCYIARQSKIIDNYYNNQLPAPDKKKKNDISIVNGLKSNNTVISVTTGKTSNFLPLILYFQGHHRYIHTLNSQIPATYITNAINSNSNKTLSDKLNGRKLQLTIEQAPISFADVAKWHMVLLLVSWEKLYFEPDTNNLVVSYKVMKNDIAEKTGSMEVKSNFTNKGKRYFQSFKSGISEYLGQYEVNLKLMTKELMNKLTEEL
ncbi:MAG: hypothetical protein WBC06_10800 [Chitinophagaceae bacterium]